MTDVAASARSVICDSTTATSCETLLWDGRSPLSSDIELLLAGLRALGSRAGGTPRRRFRVRSLGLAEPEGLRRPRPIWGAHAGLSEASGTAVLASDAAQFLALSDTDRTPDDQTVVDALSWSFAHYGSTFFRGIQSIRPGHYLSGEGEWRTREVEYFRPPETQTSYPRIEDYHEHFRTPLQEAVEARLDSDYPIVAHLSGGLDSSSIVCQAEQIHAERPGARPPLVMASALFPGQPHDEEPFIDAVARAGALSVSSLGREHTERFGVPASSARNSRIKRLFQRWIDGRPRHRRCDRKSRYADRAKAVTSSPAKWASTTIS